MNFQNGGHRKDKKNSSEKFGWLIYHSVAIPQEKPSPADIQTPFSSKPATLQPCYNTAHFLPYAPFRSPHSRAKLELQKLHCHVQSAMKWEEPFATPAEPPKSFHVWNKLYV
ncbi:hypothetical protein CDAR_392821 [Caerostris darwini]|uniref:Uncharacterized protein n=1 Tax=Caerostris darwini TaxID=1538125 RepID=A0AAV4S7Q4_9ARAC|nr:hypothetical protein CDAR_392821 [Caerostris darwini]